MLVLDGIANFLLVAAVGLRFRFVTKTVLITQKCFCYRWAVLTLSQGLFCLPPHHTNKRAGVHRKLWEGTAGTADPNWPKEYPRPYGIMLSIYSWGKETGRGIWTNGVCLPKLPLQVVEPCFPGDGWTPAWPWELGMDSLFLFACV